jgi:replicative DNA helicase
MKFEGKVEKRYIAVGEMNRALKVLAKDVNIPVLAAAQLGRQAENTRPTLADLRESGDLEQDSDNVILIHRAREINGPSEVEVIVAKRRQGRTGSVKMVWIPERVSFLPEVRR